MPATALERAEVNAIAGQIGKLAHDHRISARPDVHLSDAVQTNAHRLYNQLSEVLPETAQPIPDRPMADFDTAFVQELLSTAERQRQPNVKHTASQMIPRLALKFLKDAGLVIPKRDAHALRCSTHVLLPVPLNGLNLVLFRRCEAELNISTKTLLKQHFL